MLVKDFEARFPRPLKPGERDRVTALLGDAEALIRAEFARAGLDFEKELARTSWLESVAQRVMFEMVAGAIMVGDRAGQRQSSVTVGDITESVTWANVDGSAWGGLVLTDKHRFDLGLLQHSRARGRFPGAPVWPERRLRRVRYAR